MATHSSILAWNSDGWRSLVGYSPRGCKESDMTEQLHFHFLSLGNDSKYLGAKNGQSQLRSFLIFIPN